MENRKSTHPCFVALIVYSQTPMMSCSSCEIGDPCFSKCVLSRQGAISDRIIESRKNVFKDRKLFCPSSSSVCIVKSSKF